MDIGVRNEDAFILAQQKIAQKALKCQLLFVLIQTCWGVVCFGQALIVTGNLLLQRQGAS